MAKSPIDSHMAAHLHGVREDHVIADYAIMRGVAVGHKQTILADFRFAMSDCSAVECHEFSNDCIVADKQFGFLTRVLEILRRTGDRGAVIDFYIVADSRARFDRYMRIDHAAVADDYVIFNYRIRANGDIFTDLRFCRNYRGWMMIHFS